ncbi:MAG: hypothetical protein MK165_06225 [Pirellulaceae bacterium]|nr:hypothetical protein [Pirellulaceae bacterium]
MTWLAMLFLILLALLVLFVVIGFRITTRPNETRLVYQRLSHRFHGVYRSDSWFQQPYLSFLHGPHRVHLATRKPDRDYRAGQTNLRVTWPDEHFHLELRPHNQRGIGSSLKVRDPIARDVAGIEQAFFLSTNDNAARQRFFSDGVCWEIEKLKQLCGDKFSIHAENGFLMIRCHWQLADFDELEQLTEVSLDFFDQAFLTRCEGIYFVQQDAEMDGTVARCQVCGEDIVGDLVLCRRCKTPHHVECWQYNGCCTTYGCQETRYLHDQSGAQQGAG